MPFNFSSRRIAASMTALSRSTMPITSAMRCFWRREETPRPLEKEESLGDEVVVIWEADMEGVREEVLENEEIEASRGGRGILGEEAEEGWWSADCSLAMWLLSSTRVRESFWTCEGQC
jgi:hypothetical protein